STRRALTFFFSPCLYRARADCRGRSAPAGRRQVSGIVRAGIVSLQASSTHATRDGDFLSASCPGLPGIGRWGEGQFPGMVRTRRASGGESNKPPREQRRCPFLPRGEQGKGGEPPAVLESVSHDRGGS